MLLRSSSTPLLSSFSENTPNNNPTPDHSSNSISPHNKIGFSKHAGASPSLTAASAYYNSSPISPAVSDAFSGSSHGGDLGGLRRARSDGNLEALASASSNYIDDFTFSVSKSNRNVNRRGRAQHCSNLEAIPSFSYHGCSINSEYDSESEEEEDVEEELATTNNHGVAAEKGGWISSGLYERNLGESTGMYLARGLGVSDFNFVDIGDHVNGGGGGGGGRGLRPVGFGGDGGGGDGRGFAMEEHCRKMVEENPGNSLCLRNYAQFLHQTKKDLSSAEEYYSRAILADPTDGEVLCQYAKLVWELYRDVDRARDYFERAVQTASADSHVHAAYACFLWETAEEGEEEEACLAQQIPLSTTRVTEGEGITA